MKKILLAFLFFTLAFGQLERLGPVYWHDFILAFILLINIRRLKIWRPVAWFGLAALVSLIVAVFKLPLGQVLAGSLYLGRFLACSLLIYIPVDRRYLIFFSSAIAVSGLLQYVFVPETAMAEEKKI